MNWFKRWMYKMTQDGRDMDRKPPHGHQLFPPHEFRNPMNVTLYNATGGRIVKFTRTSNLAEQVTVYIVPDGEDFEKAFSGFVTMEALKHGRD
jgi:hypothetical protein